MPELTSVPTSPSSRPKTIMPSACSSEPLASTIEATRPSTISEKYSAGPNFSATSASGGANSAISSVADRAREERADGGRGEREAGLALPRHLIAVERRHHRGRFARQVDQDGRGRAAVLRAVIDAGQHDQRRHRRQPEGDRQQHRDGGDRAEAGQHADRGAEEHADQAIQEVRQAERSLGAEPQIAESSMAASSRRARCRAAASARPGL